MLISEIVGYIVCGGFLNYCNGCPLFEYLGLVQVLKFKNRWDRQKNSLSNSGVPLSHTMFIVNCILLCPLHINTSPNKIFVISIHCNMPWLSWTACISVLVPAGCGLIFTDQIPRLSKPKKSLNYTNSIKPNFIE